MTENPAYEVGYKKPPANRRFGEPDGNPNGKTAVQKRLEMQNAEAAMRIRSRLLKAVEEKLDTSEGEAVLAMVEAAMLKLLTDSETRGLGAPTQKVDHTGDLAITSITRKIVDHKGE